jgi:putative DNA primase/helicase
MTALASVIGRKVGLRPQARTDWTVTCNLWGLIVGRPGVLKSPGLEAALSPLKRLSALAQEQHIKEYDEFKAQATVAKLKAEAGEKEARKLLAKDPGADVLALLAVPEVEEPALKRYIANDPTPAALGELLRQNPNGLLVFRDELVSLLRSLDREDQAEGRGFYLTAWNGDSSYTFDRIGRGLNLHIPAVCLSLLGGTQPGRLSEYIRHAVKGGAADDGLIQRFGLLVWPDIGGEWRDVDRLPDCEAKKEAGRVFDYLSDLDPSRIGADQDEDYQGQPDGIPYLRFDAGGLGLFQEWRIDLEQRLRSGELHPALESHLSKYRKLVPSLALIIHLAEGNTGPVGKGATLQALAWGEYLESHARRAYGSVSQPEATAAKAILKRIRNGDLPGEFSSRDVKRPGWSMLNDSEQVQSALDLLVDYDWLLLEQRETGGRPAKIYTINSRGQE